MNLIDRILFSIVIFSFHLWFHWNSCHFSFRFVFLFYFQQSTSMVLIAVCLFATVYSALGMRTVYYRDGRVCDVCTDNHDGVVPYKQSYTPEEAGKRIIYSNGQDRINSRPISSPSSSSSYIVDRGDYSPRNFYFIHFLLFFRVVYLFM